MVSFTFSCVQGERKPTTARKQGLLHVFLCSGLEKTNDSKIAWSSSLFLVIRVRENQRQKESMIFFTYSCVKGERKPTTSRKQGLLHLFLCSG
jgi:hypothetical protein